MTNKELGPSINNMSALLSTEERGVRLTIFEDTIIGAPQENNKFRNPLLNGYWVIDKGEASQVIEFLQKPYASPVPEEPNRHPGLHLKANFSYYLDVPGAPRCYVSVTRYDDGSAEFAIGDYYKYKFPHDELENIVGLLKVKHDL
jgi:hypothetical protein